MKDHPAEPILESLSREGHLVMVVWSDPDTPATVSFCSGPEGRDVAQTISMLVEAHIKLTILRMNILASIASMTNKPLDFVLSYYEAHHRSVSAKHCKTDGALDVDGYMSTRGDHS